MSRFRVDPWTVAGVDRRLARVSGRGGAWDPTRVHGAAACVYAFALHLNNAPESIAFGLLVAGCLLNWRDSVAAWQRTCLMRWMWPWLLWSVLSVMSGLWSPEHALARPSRAVLLPWLVVPVSGFVSSIAVGFLAGAVVATGTQCAAWIRIQSWERIAGVGRDLGTVSALACFASVVALGFVLFAGSPRVRKWAVAALFFALLQLAFTQGRSAILALAIATIWLVRATRIASSETPLSRGRRRAWVAAAYVLVCLCVGALVVRGFTVDRRYQREGDASGAIVDQTRFLGSRLLLVQLTVDAVRERPLLGWGRSSKSWTEAVRQSGAAERLEAAPETTPGDRDSIRGLNSAHVVWMQAALETGLIGLALLLIGATSAVVAFRRDRSREGRVAAAVAVAWLVISFGQPVISLNRAFAPVMLALGVALRSRADAAESGGKTRNPSATGS